MHMQLSVISAEGYMSSPALLSCPLWLQAYSSLLWLSVSALLFSLCVREHPFPHRIATCCARIILLESGPGSNGNGTSTGGAGNPYAAVERQVKSFMDTAANPCEVTHPSLPLRWHKHPMVKSYIYIYMCVCVCVC